MLGVKEVQWKKKKIFCMQLTVQFLHASPCSSTLTISFQFLNALTWYLTKATQYFIIHILIAQISQFTDLSPVNREAN